MTSAASRARLMTGVVLFGALVTSGCTSEASTTPSPAPQPASPSSSFDPLGGASITEITSGLETPWSLVFRGDTPLVSERDTGRVLELAADGSTREIGTVAGVRHGGEGGLLGLAVDDDQLYAYSTGDEGNRIQRFPLNGEPGELELGRPETILDELASAGYHNGGRIAFGPDGMLYAGVGDAGQASAAQDLDSLSGKILRLAPDGSVPSDNPFPGSLVYSFGHRNVQGLVWSDDGTMFASEFGQNTWDELNVIEAGGNYGWPEVEGLAGEDDYVDPVQQWSPADASPSGITVVDDTVYIANLRGSVLRAVPVSQPDSFADYYSGTYGRLRAVAPAPDGSLWFITGNTNSQGTPRNGDDRIVRIDTAG
ncbi:PQQ-dependent sugar dehydrogenase [Frigoribacterium faeni]|uniref:Glucose/arabinose dehydrogenase n=2 Tax=Frigoribacterium faeni TaxID=145483 RepID=A0A7W3JKP2_9MICO|nr:PQQ-dependent sugar dehydrogenase [Frigoribacterium faeni]MBA8814659.1 glucose/arabinose dehydrogenase [Frigoribacterium faeni]